VRASAPPAKRDCFSELERGRGTEIRCVFPTRLTEQEKAELKRITRDLLQDATCVVDIAIERALVSTALAEADHVFEPPAQPMRCEIATRQEPIVITGEFRPRVVFRGGRAVEASPGLGQVQGVSAVLAWPVVQYVNMSATVRDGMLAAINAYREARAGRVQGR
jgi:hypothetical protein